MAEQLSQAAGTKSAQERPSKLPRIGWLCVGWLPCLVGAVALIVVGVNPAVAGGVWVLALPAGFLGCWGGAVIAHELGHLVVARAFRLNPYSIAVGHGATLAERDFLGLHWALKAIPMTGILRIWPTPSPLVRIRMLLMVSAGPATNVLLACVSGALIWGTVSSSWPWMDRADGAVPLLVVLFLVNCFVAVSSLWPRHAKIDGIVYPTDGLQIRQLLEGSHATLVRLRETVRAQSSGGAAKCAGWSANWQSLLASGEAQKTLRQSKQVLDEQPLPLPLRCQFLDMFATSFLMLDASAEIDDADRYSAELLRLQPNEWTVKGTRGSVLVEMGRLEEGTKLLSEVAEHDPLAFDRAIAASYLALAEIKQGNKQAASAWLAKARAFDPDCVPLKRFEGLVDRC